MQKLLLPFFLIASVLLISSCNEEIDLVGDFRETAVVYGLLDKADSLHYIKVTRAFIGPGNALDIAQIPDSSYFKNVDATISEVVNGVTTREWTLRDTMVTDKDTNGVFYAPTEKLYYFVTRKCKEGGNPSIYNTANPSDPYNSLNDDATYKLSMTVTDANNKSFQVTSETELVSGITTTADGQTYRFEFIDQSTNEFASKGISVNGGNSHVVNASLDVGFYEYNGSGAPVKRFLWNLGELNTTPGTSKTFSVPGETFYNLVKANATDNSAIYKRNMHSINLVITGGAEELYNYMTVNKPSSSLAQSKPTYTNLQATEGNRVIGIFSSRFTYRITKTFINPNNQNLRMMTQKSVEQLCIGPITGNLNFCSQHPGDLTESYKCQ
jgi:hypothetical protein